MTIRLGKGQVERDWEEIRHWPSGASKGSESDDCVMWSEREVSEQHNYPPSHQVSGYEHHALTHLLLPIPGIGVSLNPFCSCLGTLYSSTIGGYLRSLLLILSSGPHQPVCWWLRQPLLFSYMVASFFHLSAPFFNALPTLLIWVFIRHLLCSYVVLGIGVGVGQQLFPLIKQLLCQVNLDKVLILEALTV